MGRVSVRPSVHQSIRLLPILLFLPPPLLRGQLSLQLKFKLKLCRVILDNGAQSRSVPDFVISSQGALWGARLLQYSNRLTAYSSYPIKRKLDRTVLDVSPLDCSASACKLDRILLDISPLDCSASACSISPRDRASGKFQTNSQPIILIRLS